MKVVVFMMLVLLVVAVFMVWRMYRRPTAPQTVQNITIEADQRKQIGAKVGGYGVNFAW